jgi:dUTP pyrophosphatase
VNTDPDEPYKVEPGDRIAQLVVQRIEQVRFREAAEDALPPADRGAGGFGHTGR